MYQAAYFWLYWALVKQKGLTKDLFWKIFGSPSFLTFHLPSDENSYGTSYKLWLFPLCLIENHYHWKDYHFGPYLPKLPRRQQYFVEHEPLIEHATPQFTHFSECAFNRGISYYDLMKYDPRFIYTSDPDSSSDSSSDSDSDSGSDAPSSDRGIVYWMGT